MRQKVESARDGVCPKKTHCLFENFRLFFAEARCRNLQTKRQKLPKLKLNLKASTKHYKIYRKNFLKVFFFFLFLPSVITKLQSWQKINETPWQNHCFWSLPPPPSPQYNVAWKWGSNSLEACGRFAELSHACFQTQLNIVLGVRG